jgi:hypothetical protein
MNGVNLQLYEKGVLTLESNDNCRENLQNAIFLVGGVRLYAIYLGYAEWLSCLTPPTRVVSYQLREPLRVR